MAGYSYCLGGSIQGIEKLSQEMMSDKDGRIFGEWGTTPKKKPCFFSFEEKSHEPPQKKKFFLGGVNDEYYERMTMSFPSKCIVFWRKFGKHIRRHFPYHFLWLFKFCFQRFVKFESRFLRSKSFSFLNNFFFNITNN